MKIFLRLFILFCTSIYSITLYAQTAQTQLKGIVPGKNAQNIQIVEQRIFANLYRNHSYIECFFHLRNTGEEVEAEIGLPIMNDVSSSQKNISFYDRNRFEVLINNRVISQQSIYIPAELRDITGYQSNQKDLEKYYKKNKPAYAWRIFLPKAGELQVVVRLQLPVGQAASYNYFLYQMVQSSLWKGKIERSEINVNLQGIAPELLLSASPKKYVQHAQQIKWNYLNAKNKDNIIIRYKSGVNQGNETEKSENRYFLNGKKVSQNKLEKQKRTAIAFARRGEDNIINVYTKAFVLQSFAGKIGERFPEIKRLLEKMDPYRFDTNYILILNGRRVNQDQVYEQLFQAESAHIKSLEVKDDGRQTELILEIRKFATYGA